MKARLLKVICPACGYICRITQTWLMKGTPTCPCGTRMEEENPQERPECFGDLFEEGAEECGECLLKEKCRGLFWNQRRAK